MKILVTGSAGMIGRKLVERLVADKMWRQAHSEPDPGGCGGIAHSKRRGQGHKAHHRDFSEKGVAATLILERPT